MGWGEPRGPITKCRHGDRFCPCQDGDGCHYEPMAPNPALPPSAALAMPCPRTGRTDGECCQ